MDFSFFTNRKRRVCVWVAPTVFARIKDFAKRYNISTKAAVQVLLQTNLEEWEKGLTDLYGKTPPKKRVSNNPNVAFTDDGRTVFTRP